MEVTVVVVRLQRTATQEDQGNHQRALGELKALMTEVRSHLVIMHGTKGFKKILCTRYYPQDDFCGRENICRSWKKTWHLCI